MHKTGGRILIFLSRSQCFLSILSFFCSYFQAVQNHLFGIFFIAPSAYSWCYLIGLGGYRRWGYAGPVIRWEIKCFLCNALKSDFILHQFKMERFSPSPPSPPPPMFEEWCVTLKTACGIKMREAGEKSFQKQISSPVGIKSVNLKSTGLAII